MLHALRRCFLRCLLALVPCAQSARSVNFFWKLMEISFQIWSSFRNRQIPRSTSLLLLPFAAPSVAPQSAPAKAGVGVGTGAPGMNSAAIAARRSASIAFHAGWLAFRWASVSFRSPAGVTECGAGEGSSAASGAGGAAREVSAVLLHCGDVLPAVLVDTRTASSWLIHDRSLDAC